MYIYIHVYIYIYMYTCIHVQYMTCIVTLVPCFSFYLIASIYLHVIVIIYCKTYMELKRKLIFYQLYENDISCSFYFSVHVYQKLCLI